MDPQAALFDALEALCDYEHSDISEVAYILRELADWLDKGGAVPVVKRNGHRMEVSR